MFEYVLSGDCEHVSVKWCVCVRVIHVLLISCDVYVCDMMCFVCRCCDMYVVVCVDMCVMCAGMLVYVCVVC